MEKKEEKNKGNFWIKDYSNLDFKKVLDGINGRLKMKEERINRLKIDW